MTAHADASLLEERVILLNENAEPTGETALKRTVHTNKTPYHAAFSVFLLDGTGANTLLQQRALSKQTWPGVWSNACCGHIAPGETVYDAARRRVREELGVETKRLKKLANFSYFGERDGVVEYEFCPILIAGIVGTPKPNPAEVEDTQWIRLADYQALARALPLQPGMHPRTRASFESYKQSFGSPAAYAAAHSLPTGDSLSEWSLWELLVVSGGRQPLIRRYISERRFS
jgi:isopentenyl-diphosphate delta-isomerase